MRFQSLPALLFHQPFIGKIVNNYGSAGSLVLLSAFLIDFGIGIVIRIICLRSLNFYQIQQFYV